MIADYCGARGPITLDAAAALGSAFAAQPKVDGCYGRITTDRAGRVVTVLSRAGRHVHAGLDGLATGIPLATLHAEVEAHTEAGIRAAATRGYACAHLFDVTAVDGRDVAALPYTERYGLLHQWQTRAELARADPWRSDRQGDHHDAAGRYCAPVPVDYRRFPVVEQARGPGAVRALWRRHVEQDGGEGLVVVALGARAGARNAKRKIKPIDTIDCVVIAADASAAVLAYAGHHFTVSARGDVDLDPGDVVEVAHSGWYESGVTPRFARLVRVRHDLH